MYEIYYQHDIADATLFAVIQNSSGEYWHGEETGFANGLPEEDGRVELVEKAAFLYVADFPSAITDEDYYIVTVYDPDSSIPEAHGLVKWNGTSEYSQALMDKVAEVKGHVAGLDTKVDAVAGDVTSVGGAVEGVSTAVAGLDTKVDAVADGLNAVKLSPDGLDNISAEPPTSKAQTIREMIVQLWRRAFGHAEFVRTGPGTGTLKTFADDGSVITTQQMTEATTKQVQGTAE